MDDMLLQNFIIICFHCDMSYVNEDERFYTHLVTVFVVFPRSYVQTKKWSQWKEIWLSILSLKQVGLGFTHY